MMRLRSSKTTLTDVQKSSSGKLGHKDFPGSDVCTSQISTRKFAGVSKFRDRFRARIKDPVTKKELWLGSYKSAEEASVVYLTKKAELEKEQRIQGGVCDEEVKNVVDQSGECLVGNDDDSCEGNQESALQIGSGKSKVSMEKEVQECRVSRRKIGGVGKSKKGKFVAKVTHPVSKKRIWLGSYGSVEEASMACLAKITELEKEFGGKESKGIEGGVCNEEVNKAVEQLGQCLENRESSLPIDSSLEMVSKKKNRDSSLQIDSIKEGISKKKKVVDQPGQCLVENGTDACEENRDSSLQIDSRKEGISKKKKKNQKSALQIDSRKEGISENNKVVCVVENGADAREDNRDSSVQIDSRKARISRKKKKRNQGSSLQIDARKARISKKKKICHISERVVVGFVGVSQSKSGKYVATITHPISKKKIWLGTFVSAEEASIAYLTKKAELQKEVQCKGVEESTDLLRPTLEERTHDPCSNNQDTSMKIEPIDSFSCQNASGMEDSPIQMNVESAEKESSIGSESGAEILLRTESGVPIMDSHGFLLGGWSWIDDLSLPIV